MSRDALETVRECWPQGAPDWVLALAGECNRTSQRAAGELIGFSGGMVNMVLNGKRPAHTLGNVKAAVRAKLMNESVQCPVLGEIRLTECRENAGRPFAATNPTRVRLWRACRECEHGRQS
jgi:hypothetical protein